ncbi:MAG: flagellin [Lachnospiraceae bacterium]|nr:flagellin [Lachnospiraceae bacterium]
MVIIAHDLPAMNIQRQFGVSTKKDKKISERLSSGYKINRAADDAAGLTISEKMRQQIRGLNQGTENAQDGISWVQIGDGALDEVHDMLHRMTELTVQALSDTYTDADRAAMEAEFDALQSQIDNISKNTKFNTLDIFSEHEPTYYQVEGNIRWPQDAMHNVYSPENTLVVTYREKQDDPPVSVTLTVPEGSYTTQELADELDDAIAGSPLAVKPKLNLEYTEQGCFNANLEGGVRIESLSGGLSSLLNKTYSGGSAGSLIGTTVFLSESDRLTIAAGKNDNMSFVIEDFSGGTTTKTLTLAPGKYTRNELIGLLNDALSDTDVRATKYGTGIMLSGDDCIISQFKGNMFQIDGYQYTSVFYDNVYKGEVSLTAGTFTGGTVLPASSYNNGRDVEHGSFEIVSGVNDTLTFQPNGAEEPTTITISAGRYQIGDMVSKLNTLFSQNGLALTASSYKSSDGYFSGLKITSKVNGATSDVGLSASSTAYNTLFVNRTYNVYGAQASVTNESTQNKNPYVLASKQFKNTSYDNVPLRIESGVNDKFALQIDGNTYQVTIPSVTYYNADAVYAAVNNAVRDADLGPYSGKIDVTMDSYGRIRLTGNASAQIVNLNAVAVSGNKGYADLFTTSYKNTENSAHGTTVTLDRTFPDPTTITESEKNILIESMDGKASYTLTLPTGDNVSHQAIINRIESTSGETKYTDITFSTVSASGRDNNFNASGSGQTSVTDHNYQGQGVTETTGIEGQAGSIVTRNDPATVTIPLKSSFTPGVGSDQIRLTLNGHTEVFQFDHITYTPATFAQALQQKINAVYGSSYGGAEVKASGNNIILTSRLKNASNEEMPAENTSITCSTTDSSLLRELNTTRTPASFTTSASYLIPASGIRVESGDTFEFYLNDEKKTVVLPEMNNVSGATFAQKLDQCLAAQNIPVRASSVSRSGKYQLKLTTTDAGSGIKLSYNSKTGGSVSEALYGDLTTSASVRAGTQIQQNISIGEGQTAFRYTVDGAAKTVHLTPGDYTRDTLLTELKNKLVGVTPTLSGGYLTLTSDSDGTLSSVRLSYDSSADSAMRAIWGQTVSKAPELFASFEGDTLKLRSKDGTEFKIRSTQTSYIDPIRTSSVSNPTRDRGYYSTKHATIDGGDLTISTDAPLVIDDWNDTLQFNYFRNTTATAYSVTVAHGTYTSYDQLRTELQSKLDSAVGSGELSVTVDPHGVVIRAEQAGYARGFGSVGYTGRTVNPPLFGDFYDKVMNNTSERTIAQSVSTKVGSNVAGTDKLPYVIGRRNVKDKPVTIKPDINDTLTLDFAYTDGAGVLQNKTFSMTLDPGTYQGNSLANMIQGKLNEQLQAEGLAPNLIEVKIGGTNAVVAGVDNDKVLTFKLSNSLPLPSSGEYTIDGIGGNAAFSVFYQTTGELVPAYVEGVKDITEGVTIDEGCNVLSFTTDDQSYSIEIPAGKYTGDGIINTLNTLLTEQNAPVRAEKTDDGQLKLSHRVMGNHPITDLAGTARGSLFFNEHGAVDEDRSIPIQFSSQLDDFKNLERPPMSTAFLGINTVTVSKTKYAGKANRRVSEALNRVSEIRSYFGASQNAIEHVVNRNNNTAENMQAAESRIRDADMASEMLAHATQQILMQTGQAVLAQANRNRDAVLQLLRQ